MASKPPNGNSGSNFQPAFKRIAQDNDFDSAFACIAMIAGTTLKDVRQVAIDKFELPTRGPWWITEEMITGLCKHYGWIATEYKEATKILELPDICILVVDYQPKAEMGRHVLFHRQRAAAGVEYIIDPAYWLDDPTKQIRMDVKGIPPPLWYVALHATKQAK